MRWFGPFYSSNIINKNGRDITKLIQNQGLRHMLPSKKMFGRSLETMLKRGLESI
jgi:hypothetical protein